MRGKAMRQEILVSGPAMLDSASSRRSTVMQLYLRKRGQPADIRLTRRRSDPSRPPPWTLVEGNDGKESTYATIVFSLTPVVPYQLSNRDQVKKLTGSFVVGEQAYSSFLPPNSPLAASLMDFPASLIVSPASFRSFPDTSFTLVVPPLNRPAKRPAAPETSPLNRPAS